MAKEAVLQVRMESSLKTRAEAVFRDEGTTLVEAVRVFVRESVDKQGFPFPLKKAPQSRVQLYGLHHACLLVHKSDADLRASEADAWKRAAEAKHDLGA